MLTKKCSQHFQKNSDGKIFTAVQKIINKKNKKVKVRGIWGLESIKWAVFDLESIKWAVLELVILHSSHAY
jgi:hypothetical protein